MKSENYYDTLVRMNGMQANVGLIQRHQEAVQTYFAAFSQSFRMPNLLVPLDWTFLTRRG